LTAAYSGLWEFAIQAYIPPEPVPTQAMSLRFCAFFLKCIPQMTAEIP
jgi:hypothetical protein